MGEQTYTEQQRHNMEVWRLMQEISTSGRWPEMDELIHEEFQYVNPSRPDLRGYQGWKASPMRLHEIFRPCNYSILEMTVEGDDKVWALCRFQGRHVGGRYMGLEPTGKSVDNEWISIIHFKDGKIVRIKSISDVLGRFIQLGVLDKSLLPVDPYR